MATKKSSSQQTKKAEWKGYHNVNLTKDEEALFETWLPGQVVSLSDFDILVNNGYKISFNWDNFHSGCSASLYCAEQKMEWAGYTLTAWAGDCETAIKLLFFKHYVLCEERWEVAKDNSERQHSKFG